MNKISVKRKKELEDIKVTCKVKCGELYPMILKLKKELSKWEEIYAEYCNSFQEADQELAESKVIRVNEREKKGGLDIDPTKLTAQEASYIISLLQTKLEKRGE